MPGIHSATARLADGRRVVYHYAWRNGPRLPGEPGSAEFLRALEQARATRKTAPAGQLLAVIRAYQTSPAFLSLAPLTQRDYRRQIARIEAAFGDFPTAALSDPRTRGVFLRWRDQLGTASPRQADYAYSVLALIVQWALDRGDVAANPCERPRKLYRADRSGRIWTADDEAAFRAAAPPHLHLALDLAASTGQRQGDLLRLTWTAYDGQALRLRQSKGRQRVTVPLLAEVRAALDAAKQHRRAATILETTRGTPWTSDGFRTVWGRAATAAGVEGLTFHDLRGTAVTRLAIAGCTVPEIATITGHSLRDVATILDAHYLSRDSALGQSAITKLAAHRARTPFTK